MSDGDALLDTGSLSSFGHAETDNGYSQAVRNVNPPFSNL